MDDLPAQLRDYIDGVAAPVELTEVVARGRGEGATGGPNGAQPERTYLLGHTDHEMVALPRPHAHRRRAIAVLAAVAAVIVVTVAVAVTRPSARHQPPVAPLPLPVTTVPLPPPSGPQLYWRDAAGIGRANLDGTGSIRRLIPLTVGVNQGSSVKNGGCGLAVDHNYLYWPTGDTLARAKLDGTGIDAGFIATGPGTNCVAVDGVHIYWSTTATATSGGTIGRANLDGTAVQRAFIPDAKAPCGLAVDGGHIYWGDSAVVAQPPGGGGPSPSTGAIGRANLDGTGVNQDFIAVPPSPTPPCGVVVDGANIYWGAGPVPTGCLTCFQIGTANLEGPGLSDGFDTRGPGPLGSFNLPCAVDSTHLYWTYSFNGNAPGNKAPSPWAVGSPSNAWIGRALLDSARGGGISNTDLQADFITTSPAIVDAISGCAIGP